MVKGKLNHGSPEVLEAQRIAEIKALSYAERINRLLHLIEVSYVIKMAAKKQLTEINESGS